MLKTLKALYKPIKIETTKLFVRSYRSYVKAKHNSKSDVCFIAPYNKDMIGFYTSQTQGVVPTKDILKIRRMVGENVLNIYGIPAEDFIPEIYLFITLETVLTIGIKKSLEMLSNWKGNSYIGDIEVIRYR